MVKISLAIATFNEEENIRKCLDSVAGLVSEIVAVDGTSKDKTVNLLKEYGARVEVRENPLNFHINKIKAINKCTGDWILQLDADEEVTPELKKEIQSVLQNPRASGFWIARKNMFMGRFLTKGGVYPDYTLRLYRRGSGNLPGESVHEQAKVSGNTAYLKNPLLHYPYPDFRHYLKHFSLYTGIFASEYKDKKLPVNPVTAIDYLLLKPAVWFLKTYVRHKGFVDGFPGFVFSFFSSLRFPVSYIKFLKIRNENRG